MTVSIHDGGIRAAALKPFNENNRANFYGVDRARAYGTGWLRGHALRSFERDRTAGVIDYTLYSYATPIAWHVSRDDGRNRYWVIVDDSFSPSTNRHQSALWRLSSQYGGETTTDPAEHVGVPKEVQWCSPAQKNMILRIVEHGHVVPRGQELRTIGKLAAYGIVHGASHPLPGDAWVLKPEILNRISA